MGITVTGLMDRKRAMKSKAPEIVTRQSFRSMTQGWGEGGI